MNKWNVVNTVVIMVKNQTPYIRYLNPTIQEHRSTRSYIYNTEILYLTFVIKWLLHDYVIDATCVVLGSYYTRMAEHIMSLAQSSISACSS